MKKLLFLVVMCLIIIPLGVSAQPQTVSGLVVDASGLNIDRCMSPLIIDTTGKILNKTVPIDIDWVTANGAVEYISKADYAEISNGKSRAGDNFIIVKAIKAENFNRNVVISAADAEKVLKLEGIKEVLQNSKIVFLY